MEDASPTRQGAAAPRRHDHRRAWIAVAALAAAATLYYAVFLVVGYTEDAYVWSDLVVLASEVGGPVQSVVVHDNQRVEKGDLVATIDPRVYELAIDLKESEVANLEANVAVKLEGSVADAANADAARAALIYAQSEYDRVKALAADATMSLADLDRASDTLRAAKDKLADRQAKTAVSNRDIAAAKAAVAVARASLALARYDLSRTRVTASVRGYVNNLTLRPGDYARAGEGLVGLVDTSRWRVIANFKEEVAAGLEPGHRVWIWLDGNPWHIRTGTVQGVARGIARRPEAERILPYVTPTTDWIRLRRRLPVTIFFDPPIPSRDLFMGADARVFLVRR